MTDQFTIVDPDKNGVRLASRIGAPGATPGDVMTVGADGYIDTEPGGGSGFQGWVPDAGDPAFVTATGNNGGVEFDDGTGGFAGVNAFGVYSNPSTGNQAFAANNSAGATVALDAGGMIIQAFSTLHPFAPPQVPASPTVQDVVDALVTLGLITQA